MPCQCVVMNCLMIVNFVITHRPCWPGSDKLQSIALIRSGSHSCCYLLYLVCAKGLDITCFFTHAHARRHTYAPTETQIPAVPPSDQKRGMWKWADVEACCLWLLVFGGVSLRMSADPAVTMLPPRRVPVSDLLLSPRSMRDWSALWFCSDITRCSDVLLDAVT